MPKKKKKKKKVTSKMAIPKSIEAKPSDLCPKFDIETLKFSVEIEWNNNHNIVSCFDSSHWVNHPEHCGMEVKSSGPFTGFHGIAIVEKGCRRAEQHNTKFDDCGMHIHIDVSDILSKPEFEKTEIFRNIISNFRVFERAIMFLQHSARIAICESRKYIRTLDYADLKKIKRATTVAQIMASFPDRYFGLNFHGIKDRPAVEFRYHRGTFSFEEIMFWLFVFAKLIHFSKHGIVIKPKSVTSVDTHDLARQMVVDLGLDNDCLLIHNSITKKITRYTIRDFADVVAKNRLNYKIYDVTVGKNFNYTKGKSFSF